MNFFRNILDYGFIVKNSFRSVFFFLLFECCQSVGINLYVCFLGCFFFFFLVYQRLIYACVWCILYIIYVYVIHNKSQKTGTVFTVVYRSIRIKRHSKNRLILVVLGIIIIVRVYNI